MKKIILILVFTLTFTSLLIAGTVPEGKVVVLGTTDGKTLIVEVETGKLYLMWWASNGISSGLRYQDTGAVVDLELQKEIEINND